MKLFNLFGKVAIIGAIAASVASCGARIPTCEEVACESKAVDPPYGIVYPKVEIDPALLNGGQSAFIPQGDTEPEDSEGGAARL